MVPRDVTQPWNIKAGIPEGPVFQESPEPPMGLELPRVSGKGIFSRGNTVSEDGLAQAVCGSPGAQRARLEGREPQRGPELVPGHCLPLFWGRRGGRRIHPADSGGLMVAPGHGQDCGLLS